MPDTKFSQFTDGGAIIRGDTVVGLRGGVNTKFFFDNIDSPTTINFYVSNQGNNATARPGSPVYPYKTAKAAFDVIISNGDFSATKNYAVYLQGVVTETAQVKVPPFCHLLGDGSLHNLGGFTLIHNATSWGAANQFFTFNNIDYTGQSISFLLSALANNIRSIKFHNCISGTFSFTGASTLTDFIFQNNLTTNPYLGGNGTLTGNGGAYLFTGATNFDTVTITNAVGQSNISFDANILPRMISCNSNGSSTLTAYLFACDPQLNGTGITMNASADACQLITDMSVPNGSISLLNGATVSLSSQAQMLLPGFNATNYTPSTATTGYPTSVKNHLQGIDTSLHKITIDLHVSAQGDDTNGTGAITAPYLTAAKAFTVASSGSPTAAKIYNVYLHGVVTESGTPLIPQFTNIIGDGSLWSFTTFSLNPGIFGAADSVFNCINVRFAPGATINFDISILANVKRNFFWKNCIFAVNEDLGTTAITLTGLPNVTYFKFDGCIGSDPEILPSQSLLTIDGGDYHWTGGQAPSVHATAVHSLTSFSAIGTQLATQLYADTTGSGGGSIYFNIYGCDAITSFTNCTLNATDGGITVTQDSGGINRFSFTILGGTPSIHYGAWAQFLNVSFTPNNYTPTTPPAYFDVGVEQHLQGIDNALTGTASVAGAGNIFGLSQTWVSISTLTMGTGWIDIYNGTTWVSLHYASPITLNIATIGANGLDTGTVANNTWYYILAIGGTSPPAWLLTASPASPVYPAGYTYSRIVGATKSSVSTTDLLQYNFMGMGNDREYQWTEIAHFTDLNIVNASSSVSLTGINCFPGQADEPAGIQSRKVKLRIVFKSTGVGDFIVLKDNNDASLNFYSTIAQITANDIDTYVEVLNPSGQLRYSISTLGTVSTSLFIRGFTISV